jgi:hypothetical protein
VRLRTLITAAALAASAAGALAAVPPLERGDAAWTRRAEGADGERARPEPVREAIAGYEAAIAAAPDALEPRWKLLRALWFAGDFASGDPAAEKASYERGIAEAERAFDVLAARVGGRDALDAFSPEALRAALPAADAHDAASLYFWSAVNLGAWARQAGLLSAVRAGVANRLREQTERSIALDPSVELGGAIRLLSRLHSELPRVPLFSGWVDHARAVPLAERALAEYPAHPGNAYLLGLALLGHAPERRGEALGLIARTAELQPRSDHVIEDLAIRRAAREQLEGLARDP